MVWFRAREFRGLSLGFGVEGVRGMGVSCP